MIELERRKLAALPAEDPRHRAELRHQLVELVSSGDPDLFCPLRDRRTISQGAAVHRGFQA